MSGTHARTLLAAACCWLIVGLPAFGDLTEPVELRPYVVHLEVGFVEGPLFPMGFRERTLNDVERLINRTVGERWSLTLSEASPERRQPGPSSFPGQDTTEATASHAATRKAIRLSIDPQGPEYRVTAQEYDELTSTIGPRHTLTVSRREEISTGAIRAALQVFRPLGTIGVNDDGVASLALRASGIPTPDPNVVAITPGTIFLPFLRKFDREGTLVETRAVPFTVLQVNEVGESSASAEVHSALRSPLGGRRATVEAWAIAASASFQQTRLTVVRREDGVPLAGRIVEIRDKPFQPGMPEADPAETLLTDRSGTVTLPVTPNRSVDWLTIKSGDATLMRLPVVPGVEQAVTLPLGDDQRRLDTEGRLAILTGELIETVAKRATLLASARSNARAGNYFEADDALAQAAKLPDAPTFRRRLAAVETPAAKAAEDEGDRLAAARIRALGRKASSLVDRYLNPDALRATQEEVEELKRTDPNRK